MERTREYKVLQVPSEGPLIAVAAQRMLDAHRRYRDLKSLLERAIGGWSAHLYARARLDDREGTVRLEWPDFPAAAQGLTGEATPLISEVLLHTRSALDYCVYHGVWTDSGTRNELTQFPLEGSRSGWVKAAKGQWLRGLSAEHRAWVEEVQPFSGVKWSALLKEYSNQDKHRLPVRLSASVGVKIDMQVLETDPLGDPEWIAFKVLGRTVDLLLAAEDGEGGKPPGQSVVPVLSEIVMGAIPVVNRFLTAYGENPVVVSSQSARRRTTG